MWVSAVREGVSAGGFFAFILFTALACTILAQVGACGHSIHLLYIGTGGRLWTLHTKLAQAALPAAHFKAAAHPYASRPLSCRLLPSDARCAGARRGVAAVPVAGVLHGAEAGKEPRGPALPPLHQGAAARRCRPHQPTTGRHAEGAAGQRGGGGGVDAQGHDAARLRLGERTTRTCMHTLFCNGYTTHIYLSIHLSSYICVCVFVEVVLCVARTIAPTAPTDAPASAHMSMHGVMGAAAVDPALGAAGGDGVWLWGGCAHERRHFTARSRRLHLRLVRATG